MRDTAKSVDGRAKTSMGGSRGLAGVGIDAKEFLKFYL